jgi:hypothetical protein
MRNIKNLIQVAEGQVAKRPVLKAGNSSQKNKQAQLYDLIFNKESIDEDQIARQLYGIKADASSHNYIKLKSRLKQKLLDSLFFLEPNNKDIKLNVNATKQIYLGKVLYHLGVNDIAEKTIQKGMQAAIQIEHFDLAFGAASQLLKIGFETNNMVLYHSAAKQIAIYENLTQFQCTSQRRFFETQLLIKSAASTEKIIASIDEANQRIEKAINVKEFFSFSIFYYQNKHLKLKQLNDYPSILNNSLEAIEVLNRFENTPDHEIFYFKVAYLEACKSLQAYKTGNEFLARISTFENNQPFDEQKITLHQYATLFNFGLQQYKDALHKIELFVNSKSFKILPFEEKAKWKLLKLNAEIALYLTTTDRDIRDEMFDSILRKQTKNVLEELDALNDDKHGQNVALKTLEIMLRILKDEIGTLMDKMDSFKTYKSRYLRLDDHKRANYFFSLIINLEKNGFHINKTNGLEEDLHHSLKNTDVKMTSKLYEIIPFNHLWEFIVKILSDKKLLITKSAF